jgi:hypothetical protein
MKLNNKLPLLISLLCISFVLLYFNRYGLYERFNNLENIIGSSDLKLQDMVISKTEKLVSKDNLGSLDDSDVNEMVDKYINKHLLDKKKSVVPPKDSDLSNETLQAIQLIQLNELKCILEKIHNLESIKVDE